MRLFTEHGFAETTARKIATAVGVSEQTFLRCFVSKEDVVLVPVGRRIGDHRGGGRVEIIGQDRGVGTWEPLIAVAGLEV